MSAAPTAPTRSIRRVAGRVLVTAATTLAVSLLGVTAALVSSPLVSGGRSQVDASTGVAVLWVVASVGVAVATTLFFVRGAARLLPLAGFATASCWFLTVLT